MSTCVPYKQLGEVGGLLWLTSPRRFFFICIALLLQKEGKKKKNPQNFYNSAILSIASGGLTAEATRQTRAVNFSETTTIRTHWPRICLAACTPTHALPLSRCQTFSHFLAPLSALQVQTPGPYPLLWMRPSGASGLFAHPRLCRSLFRFSRPHADHIH